MIRVFSVSILFFLFFSCVSRPSLRIDDSEELKEIIPEEITQEETIQEEVIPGKIDEKEILFDQLSAALINAQLPSYITENILQSLIISSGFIYELNTILNEDPFFWVLVDKERFLDRNYEPQDLITLNNGFYRINRTNLFLRKDAAASLEIMAAGARAEGLTLVISSAYRSYNQQEQIYTQNVSRMGRQAADRVSARPGHSQHQLGLTVDFGSITNSFAVTQEGIWLAANASRFGWSLSYPDGYEHVTGYSWESWHYRYVGIELAQFIDKYFDGIQQYALRFIYEYQKL